MTTNSKGPSKAGFGSIKEAIGKITGDAEAQADGAAEKRPVWHMPARPKTEFARTSGISRHVGRTNLGRFSIHRPSRRPVIQPRAGEKQSLTLYA